MRFAFKGFVVLATQVALGFVACSRPQDEAWVVTEDTPPLASSLTTNPPPDVYWFPRFNPFPSPAQTWGIVSTRTVRQRATGVPTLLLTIEEKISIVGKVVEKGSTGTTLKIGVDSVEVTAEPPIEAIETGLGRDRSIVSIKLRIDEQGKIINASHVRRHAGDTEALGPLENDLVSMLAKLWPVAPDRPVQIGDSWPFSIAATRPTPGGGTCKEAANGAYHFAGLATVEGREVAVVKLDYEIEVSGTPGGNPRLDGTGVGQGIYFLEMDSGRVLRSQIVESIHLQAKWPGRRKTRSLEQVSRSFYEIVAVAEEQ